MIDITHITERQTEGNQLDEFHEIDEEASDTVKSLDKLQESDEKTAINIRSSLD